MNNNRHMQYRRRVMRKRRIRLALILSAIFLVLLVAVFLIFGNLLAKDQAPSEEPDAEDTQTETEAHPLPVPPVKARPTLLETADTSTLSGRLRAIAEQEATAASVPLNQADGTLLYRSSTALSLGLGNDAYAVTIAGAVKQADNYDLRLSGIWYVTVFEESDELLRSVKIAETAAILAEAVNAGLDDILLISPVLDENARKELTLLAEEIRRLAPKAVLGLCLSDSLWNEKGYAVAVDDMVSVFDFLAVDASAYGEDAPAAYVESVAAERLDYLLRYRMRLLLPSLSDQATEDSVIAAAEQYSVTNWQILP